MKIITYKQFDRAVNKQVNDNIKKYGTSLASCTIQDNCHNLIECIRQDTKELEMVDNWRELIKTKGIIENKMPTSIDGLYGEEEHLALKTMKGWK